MKKYALLFIVCFLIFVPALKVEAVSAPVTSPFGWRTHPVFGTQRFHSGVDLGIDEGTPLTAILPGTVEAAGWMGGYGWAVLIDHGNGRETLFGHCNQILVSDGQHVSAGQIVALSGNSGWSTGPHLHVELRVNGSPVDPMPLLLQSGWDISGEYSPSQYYMNSDYDEMLWDFGDFYDIARVLREIMDEFGKHWSQALGYVQGDLVYLLRLFMTIDLALSFIYLALKQDEVSGFFHLMVSKILNYGLLTSLLINWKDFINNFILDFVTSIAIKAAGGGEYIAENMSDPSLIVQKGIHLIQPVFAFLGTFSGFHMIANVHHVFWAMITGFGIFICFLLIGIQMMLTYLEFYATCLFAVVTIPTGALKQTQFIGDKGISGVINAGFKLMIMTFVVGIAVYHIKDFESVAYDPIVYCRLLVFSVGLAYLVGKVPERISEIMQVHFRLPTF